MNTRKPTNLKECDETGCLDCKYLKIHSKPACFGSSITLMDKTENSNGHPKCRQRQIFQHYYYVSLSPEKEMTYEEQINKLKKLKDEYPTIKKCIEIAKLWDRLDQPLGGLGDDSVEEAFVKLEKLLKSLSVGE